METLRHEHEDELACDTCKPKQVMAAPQLEKPRELANLHETFYGGIRKILYASGEIAFVSVEDNGGPNFTVAIPQPGHEDKTPLWHFEHSMLFGPELKGRGNVYAAPDGI